MYHVDTNVTDTIITNQTDTMVTNHTDIRITNKRNHLIKTMLDFFISKKMILQVSSKQPRFRSIVDFRRIEILQLSVIIFDKYMSSPNIYPNLQNTSPNLSDINSDKIHFISNASLFIAYKFHITCGPLINHFELNDMTRNDIINTEYQILETINYKIWYFTIYEQLRELFNTDTCITYDDTYTSHVESISIYYSVITIFFKYYDIITNLNLVGKLHTYLKSMIYDEVDIIYEKNSGDNINKLFLSMWYDVYISNLIDNHMMYIGQETLNKFINTSKKIRKTENLITCDLITKINSF